MPLPPKHPLRLDILCRRRHAGRYQCRDEAYCGQEVRDTRFHAVVVVPAGRAAGGDGDLVYGHVGCPAAADHNAVRRRALGQDAAAHPRTRYR